MIDVVYALASQPIGLATGQTIRVQKGSHWPATDPVVLAHPSLFTSDSRYGLCYTAPPPGYDTELAPLDVEAATANPGERRSVRRS